MKTSILDSFVEKSNNNENFKICFKCGTKVPKHLVACWNCGQVLKENIRKLAQNK